MESTNKITKAFPRTVKANETIVLVRGEQCFLLKIRVNSNSCQQMGVMSVSVCQMHHGQLQRREAFLSLPLVHCSNAKGNTSMGRLLHYGIQQIPCTQELQRRLWISQNER